MLEKCLTEYRRLSICKKDCILFDVVHNVQEYNPMPNRYTAFGRNVIFLAKTSIRTGIIAESTEKVTV